MSSFLLSVIVFGNLSISVFHLSNSITDILTDVMFGILLIIFSYLVLHIKMFQKIENLKQSLLVILLIIVPSLIANWDGILKYSWNSSFSALLTGFREEIFFRGLIFLFLLELFSKNKNKFMYSAVISSIIFAVAHFLNILTANFSVNQAIYTVAYAFVIGMFLALLLFLSKNLITVIFVHFILDLISSGTTTVVNPFTFMLLIVYILVSSIVWIYLYKTYISGKVLI